MLLAFQILLNSLPHCVCVSVVADGNVYDILHKATSIYSFAVKIQWAVPLPVPLFSSLDSFIGFERKTLSLLGPIYSEVPRILDNF